MHDMIDATEELGNGSSKQFWVNLGKDEPAVLAELLVRLSSKALPQNDEGLQIEGERVYRTADEVAAEMRRRGLPVPDDFRMSDIEREREALIAGLQTAQARASEAMRRADEAELQRGDVLARVIRSVGPQ
jgi:hypothetical protein